MSLITNDRHTIAEHTLTTTDGAYELYVQEWGSVQGIPIIYVHGGPGSGCNDSHKTPFDPARHHVIFIDQRGSGRSTPYARTESNTTQLLIADIEQIRTKLSLESFVLFGRSWGSTLALCYAIAHPQRVTRIITGGISLGTQAEDEWLAQGHFGMFYPEVWDTYGADKDSILKYARLSLPTLRLDDRYTEIDEVEFDESFFTIQKHYAKNNRFIPEGYILEHASTLTMPITIIQGRYDMLTPPMSAHQLHKALPNSTLQWTIAGHSQSDRSTFDALKAVLLSL